jgi:acyl-homoserine-lactone acylase
MSTRAKRFLPFILITLITACAPLSSQTARTVLIQRTTWGVAHIEAGDFESLAYGVAYAHAQDNVCQTADHLLTVSGERSKFLGGSAVGLLGLRPLPNEQIDTLIRMHMDDRALAAANAGISDDAKAIARGYVAGYNRFLADHTGRLPAPCNGQPWVRPMTLGDHLMKRAGRRSSRIGALGGSVKLRVRRNRYAARHRGPERERGAAPWRIRPVSLLRLERLGVRRRRDRERSRDGARQSAFCSPA